MQQSPIIKHQTKRSQQFHQAKLIPDKQNLGNQKDSPSTDNLEREKKKQPQRLCSRKRNSRERKKKSLERERALRRP